MKNMNTTYAVTNGKAVLIHNGARYAVSNTEAHWAEFTTALYQEDFEKAIGCLPLANLDQKIGKYLSYENGAIYFDGKPVVGPLVELLVQFVEEVGAVPVRYVRFVDRLMSNVSYRVREQLWKFLEYGNFTILEDGRILMFKAVKPNFLDIYSGTIDNSPGKKVAMQRALVDDDPGRGCSAGLHVGTVDYIVQYGGSHSVFIGVAVDPGDIVSVPHDHDYQKVRTCAYEVLFVVDRNSLDTYRPVTEVTQYQTEYKAEFEAADDDICDLCGVHYDDCECDDDYDDWDDDDWDGDGWDDETACRRCGESHDLCECN